MKTPTPKIRNPQSEIRNWLLLALALSFAFARPAAGNDPVMARDPVGGKADVFTIINFAAGKEPSIHGVPQLGATIVVNVTISGALIGATRIPVTFSPALASAPLAVLPILQKTTSAEDNVLAVTYDTVTSSGFFVNLSGPAIAGQIIHNFVFCP